MPTDDFLQHLERIEKHKKTLWETRKAAVLYYQQGRDPAWIAQRLGVQVRVVQDWIQRFKAGGLESLRPYQRSNQVSPEAQARHSSSAAQEESQPTRHSPFSRRFAFLRQLILEPR